MRCRISGRVTDSEIPLLVMLFYLFHYVESIVLCAVVLVLSVVFLRDLRGRQRQLGSLAGAAHLLKDNAGVLRQAQ